MASKRNETACPTSTLNRAADGEPLFILRANDELAPLLVREWAYRYWEQKGGAKRMLPEQMKKYNEAMNLALFMERWKEGQSLKEQGS
jgi:hypothetical protein